MHAPRSDRRTSTYAFPVQVRQILDLSESATSETRPRIRRREESHRIRWLLVHLGRRPQPCPPSSAQCYSCRRPWQRMPGKQSGAAGSPRAVLTPRQAGVLNGGAQERPPRNCPGPSAHRDAFQDTRRVPGLARRCALGDGADTNPSATPSGPAEKRPGCLGAGAWRHVERLGRTLRIRPRRIFLPV